MRVVVVCPAGVVTGGPENLHQMVDELVSRGVNSSILYWPPSELNSTPDAYKRYRVPLVSSVPEDTSVVVLPETLANLVPHFPHHRVWLFWLSIDNFYRVRPRKLSERAIRRLTRASSRGPLGATLFRRLFRGVEGHLAQSHYADEFLRARGLDSRLVGDYIVGAEEPSAADGIRPILVSTNGNKGRDYLQEFKRRCSDVEVFEIRGLDSDAVTQTLKSSEVYIDFGNHPGRDRLPREAAMAGCVVMVRLAGAAANPSDVPISSEFKFEVDPSSLDQLVRRLREVLADRDSSFNSQMQYRNTISRERDQFRSALEDWCDFISKGHND